MNEFSIPLFFEKSFIDEAVNINKECIKSKITNFYFALLSNCAELTGFEQIRNSITDKSKLDDFKPVMEYALNKGFDLIYLLNSPRPLSIESPDFNKQLEKLDFLLNELKSIGVNKLRVSNPKLLTYLSIHYKDFILYASTSFEYKTLKEYQNFIAMHPTVKQIVPSHDVTKNFKLLQNLKKCLPNIEIELLADEGCMGGCPHRFTHSSEYLKEFITPNKDISLSNYYCHFFCSVIFRKSPVLHICKSNNIYPWEIKEYNKIGINKFKLAGRDVPEYKNNYKKYLLGVDDIKNIENESFDTFIYHLYANYTEFKNYKVKDIKPYLPDINYFKKHGHLCASVCKVDCTYCYECAKKIELNKNKFV